MPTARSPEQKRYRERANRARRNLLHQQEEFGTVRDGSGIRYLVVPWYVLAGEPAKAAEFGVWFDLACGDDIGEPVFWLFRALAHHRLAQPQAARWFLLQAMVSNIYLLPRVFGEPLPRQPIWHWSNEAEPEWLEGNEEFLDAPSDQERAWIRGIWESEAGVRLREGYLHCFRRLVDLRGPDARGEVLAEWQALLHEVLGEQPGAS